MIELVKEFLKTLSKKKLTIAFAESMTCGLASNELNLAPGTSEVLLGGIICYNENVKKELFGIPAELIDKFSAESQEVTDALAQNLSRLIRADICFAITGLNADGGSENPSKPVGTVFFSMYYDQRLAQKRMVFDGSPQEIKKKAVSAAYKMILEELEK